MAISTRRLAYRLESRTLTSAEVTEKKIVLSRTPHAPNLVVVFVKDSGTHLVNSQDFQLTGAELSWAGYEMDGILEAGDKMSVLLP